MLRTSIYQASKVHQHLGLLNSAAKRANPALVFRPTGFRNFSSATSKESAVTEGATKATSGDSESIFASADYFKEANIEQDTISAETTAAGASDAADSLTYKADQLMWMDANDSLGTTMSLATKDVENLVQGVQTYGFSESLVYYESLIWDLWIFFAETQGMGMGLGLIATSLVTRAMFAPVIMYSVSLQPLFQPLTNLIVMSVFSSKLWA